MVAESTTLSAAGTSNRRRWVPRLAALSLVALIAVVVFSPGLRSLAASTWREMRSISPALLALIVSLKTGQAIFSALVWRNALLCAWPARPQPYGLVLGVEQGQNAINTVMPARAGTWAMLGIFAYALGRARPAKLLAVWAVQSLAFGVFAAISYVIIAVGVPGQSDQEGPIDRIVGLVSARPVLATAIGVPLAVAAGVGLYLARGRVAAAREQVLEGFAIVRPPARYLRLLFLPSLISHAFSVGSYAVLLSAFEIPVTVHTVALALGSNALAGAVRITPGGLGTTQALDVIALRAYAPADVVTAYSLSEIAITALVSLTVAVVALLLTTGLRDTRRLLGHIRGADPARGLHALNERQRLVRQRVRQRVRHRRVRPRGDR